MLNFIDVYNRLYYGNPEIKATSNNDFFWFIFDSNTPLFDNQLQPQYITRFIKLCCHANYNNDLSAKNNKKIYKNDLSNILLLQPTTLNKTIKTLKDKSLIELYKNKIVYVSKEYFSKGKINRDINETKSTICFFTEPFKNIYKNIDSTQHKILGNILKLVPYMNTYNNIICTNTTANEYEKCNPLTQKEIMDIIGISNTNGSKFLKDSKQISFMELPLLIKYKSSKNGNIEFMLNPNICCGNPKQQKIILKSSDINFKIVQAKIIL